MKDKIVGWIETIRKENGPLWALLTVALLGGLAILAMYLKVNPLEWLN